MPSAELHVVTGALGYSGKYIAARLIKEGHRVRTLTNSIHRPNPFGDALEVLPFNFDKTDELAASLQGASVLYNTYWVRFNSSSFTFAEAIRNSFTLFAAAKRAGVRRIVHISITNPSEGSDLQYFRGKALLEKELIGTGISYAILRPALLFGGEDILLNNIAWTLRRLPIFGVFGDGKYCLQPIFVEDLAELAVTQGAETENKIIDAIGPETFTYRELVRAIGEIIGHPRPIISVPPKIAYLLVSMLGKLLNDVIITRDEIEGLLQNRLCTASPPAGKTRLTDWARENADTLGKQYHSEMARRRNRAAAYR